LAIPHKREVAFVTPWYPTLDQPYRGAFVRAAALATSPACGDVTVYHCDDWAHWLSPRESAAVDRAYRELLPIASSARPSDDGTRLVYLPVPSRAGGRYADTARRHASVLAAALSGAGLTADIVHAHVGLPSGWAAAQVARPDALIFVTEHASFLERVLAEPDARSMYDELLGRCAGLFAVGNRVRRPLVEAFPHHANRICILPTPVTFGPARQQPVEDLRRWLFVGALTPAKGVFRLLEAFAISRAQEPELTLTFVGDGQSRGALVGRVAELGLDGAVTLTGALLPDDVPALMRQHDLLVHPSRSETFGLAVVEAIAAGMPVLVTRCGGPEETLAGIGDAAGEFVDVADDPESLVAGYMRLRARFPASLDLPRARHELERRYGYAAYAEAQVRAWFAADRTDG
jgi:glycosyltransferase involved in cell wall biosynthesis